MEINWTGPYSWPKFEHKNNLQSIPGHPGIYLQTFEYRGGYLIYAAGITRRPIPVRFREHTRKYMFGDYNVLDIAAAQKGIRKEIWHGWGWNPEKRRQFEERKENIIEAVHNQLGAFRIFVANVPTSPRILQRLEASIMNILYCQPPPICDIPDKGMWLAPRWQDENPMLVVNNCKVPLHGVPQHFDI